MSDSFAVTIPGQPLSWNHMYEWTTRIGSTGQKFRAQAKKSGVEEIQTGITRIVQAARPSTFRPTGQIFVVYDFLMARELDADNCMKAMNDAIASALGVNDKQFLPVARSKQAGSKRPETRVTLLDAGKWLLGFVPSP